MFWLSVNVTIYTQTCSGHFTDNIIYVKVRFCCLLFQGFGSTAPAGLHIPPPCILRPNTLCIDDESWLCLNQVRSRRMPRTCSRHGARSSFLTCQSRMGGRGEDLSLSLFLSSFHLRLLTFLSRHYIPPPLTPSTGWFFNSLTFDSLIKQWNYQSMLTFNIVL